MSAKIDEIWKGDLLNRKEDAQLLFDFLVRRHTERRAGGIKGAYVVNLNAGWGHGKTFFLERLKLQMEAEGHLTAYVNAWRDDSSKEPVVAVMAAIEESLKPHFATKTALRQTWSAAKAHSATIVASLVKGASRKLAEKFVGQSVKEITEMLEREDFLPEQIEDALSENEVAVGKAVSTEITTLLTKFVDEKISDYQARIASAAQFQSRMKQLLIDLEDKNAVKLPFFILIDELDRCRPTYAIELLEQVKHLFDIDNTIFVIATDGDQLAHSISAVYGEQFDGKRYLLRFFHRHYRFEKRELTAFTDYLFAANEIDLGKVATPWDVQPADIFVGAMQKYNLTLRDAEQCFDILRSAVTMWPHKIPIQLNAILPLIVHFQRHELDEMKAYFENVQKIPGGSEWRVKYPHQRGPGVRAPLFIKIEELNSSLLSRMETPLNQILEINSNEPILAYAKGVFSQEFNVLHNNRWRGEGPRSVIREYYSLVRSVGRLAAPADDPGHQTVG